MSLLSQVDLQNEVRQLNISDYLDLAISVLMLFTLIGGVFYGVKKWIQSVSNEVSTGNGRTIGQLAEATHRQMEEMAAKQEQMQESVRDNSALAREALIKADMANARLDSYFRGKVDANGAAK